MRCHDPHAECAWFTACSDITPFLPTRRPGIPPGPCVPLFPAWLLLFAPVSFRLPRRRPRQRDPKFARNLRGCGRASAPARFARLIARARSRARGGRMAHVSRWPNQGLFASAPTQGEAASGWRLHPRHVAPAFQYVNRLKEKFLIFVLICNPREGRSPLSELAGSGECHASQPGQMRASGSPEKREAR